eukprot:691021-Rhodomonas_salina.1
MPANLQTKTFRVTHGTSVQSVELGSWSLSLVTGTVAVALARQVPGYPPGHTGYPVPGTRSPHSPLSGTAGTSQ